MTLVVQDSTGAVPWANSYNSVAEFKSYHADRGTPWAPASDADIESALIRATDYVDNRFSFIGKRKQGRLQMTEWPRIDAWDAGRYYINDIPTELKEAVSEYALRALTTTLVSDPERDATGGTVQSKSQTVGPITESTTYVGGAAYTLPKYPIADQKLRKAGLTVSGGNVLRG